jgi:hypothetical protein
VALERFEVAAELAEVQETVNATKQVVGRYVIVEIERVEQSLLVVALLTHPDALPSLR